MDEFTETLIDSPGSMRIERIVSVGHASPENFWYDQEEDEWVMLLTGSASLRFDGQIEPVVLHSGDWVVIPAHVRHRVEWTDPELKTVWIAVFY